MKYSKLRQKYFCRQMKSDRYQTESSKQGNLSTIGWRLEAVIVAYHHPALDRVARRTSDLSMSKKLRVDTCEVNSPLKENQLTNKNTTWLGQTVHKRRIFITLQESTPSIEHVTCNNQRIPLTPNVPSLLAGKKYKKTKATFTHQTQTGWVDTGEHWRSKLRKTTHLKVKTMHQALEFF